MNNPRIRDTGGIVDWCDCNPISELKDNGIGTYDRACNGWVMIRDALSLKTWNAASDRRPRDRAPQAANYNVQAMPSLATDLGNGYFEVREFDGFCTPCGGLRKHRLGCPVKRKA